MCRSASRPSNPVSYSRHVTPSTPGAAFFQCFKTLPQQIDSHVMQQSREPLFLPFACRSAHAAQPLGHPLPALRRTGVGLRVVLLGPPPSLRRLRREFPLFVRLHHRYYAAVRLLQRVHVRRSALRLCGPVCLSDRRAAGLPVLGMLFLDMHRAFDYATFRLGSRFCCLLRMVPSTMRIESARGSSVFGAQSPGPPMPLSTLRRTPRDVLRKTQGQNRVAAPFL